MADIEVGRHLGQLRDDLVRRADDHIAALDDVLHPRRCPRLLPGLHISGAANLPDDAGALRRLGDIARRHRPARIDPEAAAVEIFGRFAVQLKRLLAALGDPDKLQKAGAIWVPVLAKPRHLVPEALHRGAAVLEAKIGQIGVDVVHRRAPLPGLDRTTAGDPDRRVRLLYRPWPDVDVALLVEAAVEGEGVGLGPRPQYQVVRLVITVAQHARVLAIGEAGVHRRADREAGDQPPARDAVDHREFF